ncbi:hypothetical protein RD110_10915 [Rhodoferax koreense]|uniref:Uncharacterized protein n=1 Tax=Rhodoferax koreensis TaxID=1842727 RepID=A0A1P8JV76_9BURK|nr:hypothetical protein RD110_10915 [Rhodoferax koreense]
MTYQTEFTHILRMALLPGFRDHARYRAQQLESTYPGLYEAVKSELARKSSEDGAKKCLG